MVKRSLSRVLETKTDSTTAFDFEGQSSFWTTDKRMKRLKQGEEFAQRKQQKRDINDKNQVFVYSKALHKKIC